MVFSWNEGQSWYDFELGSAPLFVDNIVIEPNSSSVEFLLYGKRENDNAGQTKPQTQLNARIYTALSASNPKR